MRRFDSRPLHRARVPRLALLSLLAGVGLVIAGCSTPPPSFTFFTGSASVQVPPTQYCDVALRNCQANGQSATVATVPDNQVVQISAPVSVASTPWEVAAEFHNGSGSGNSYVSCSPLFAPSQQYAYTVRVPAGDQLVVIVVYQLGAAMELVNGAPVAVARGTWVLTNNANGNPVLPKPGDNLCEQ